MNFLYDGPTEAPLTFAFAHGAGGAMDTPFMTIVARGLGQRGIRVARFEFPYMAARRTEGKRGSPDREPVLLDSWRTAVAELGGGGRVAVGGKSLGGRMATLVADELQVRGVVCLGYPFHPPGQPQRLRTRHLETLRSPTLILQGTRDPFGTLEDVKAYRLSPSIAVEWLEDGDHSLKPRKASGFTEASHLESAIDRAAAFLVSLR